MASAERGERFTLNGGSGGTTLWASPPPTHGSRRALSPLPPLDALRCSEQPIWGVGRQGLSPGPVQATSPAGTVFRSLGESFPRNRAPVLPAPTPSAATLIAAAPLSGGRGGCSLGTDLPEPAGGELRCALAGRHRGEGRDRQRPCNVLRRLSLSLPSCLTLWDRCAHVCGGGGGRQCGWRHRQEGPEPQGSRQNLGGADPQPRPWAPAPSGAAGAPQPPARSGLELGTQGPWVGGVLGPLPAGAPLGATRSLSAQPRENGHRPASPWDPSFPAMGAGSTQSRCRSREPRRGAGLRAALGVLERGRPF